MDRIDVEAATSQLITIDAFSPRPHEAQTLSQAIADAYVQTITDNMHAVSGAIVGDLRTRRDELNQRLKDLLTQVNATKVRIDGEGRKSPAGIHDAQILAQLTASQGDIAKQLESVKGELQASGAVGTASTLASVVQPAAPATGPGRVPGLVTWGAVGALLGGALAAALVALRARRDPRLRARDDMADAVGSSVLADVRSRRQRSVAEWLALFETYVASPVDAWAFRQLLRALATMTDAAPLTRSGGRAGRLEHPRSIAVVTVAGDVRGLAIGPQLAAFAASLGITTRFVLASSHDAAASMWAACSAERAAEPRPGLRLEVRPDTPIPLESLPGAAGGSFDELLTGGSAHVNGSLAEPERLVSTLEGLVSAIDAALVSSARLDDDDDEDDADDAADDAGRGRGRRRAPRRPPRRPPGRGRRRSGRPGRRE